MLFYMPKVPEGFIEITEEEFLKKHEEWSKIPAPFRFNYNKFIMVKGKYYEAGPNAGVYFS
jgi:hypothetical protein